MKILNKLLIVIFFLVCINCVKEYIFANPKSVDSLDVPVPEGVDFSLHKRDWDYYNSIFKEGTMPVYKEEEYSSSNISLPLILRGTILGDPTKSFAIIEDISTKKQDLYRLGEDVYGAKIVSMTREKVVLDYEGRKYELQISDKKENKENIVSTPNINKEFVVENDNKALKSSFEIPFTEKPNIDFSKLLTQLKIRPYFESGKCIGFQLDNINSGFIKQMGLKNGDVIQSINGVKIDDPLKALQILYGIQSNNPVHLGVGRGDEKIEMECKVEG